MKYINHKVKLVHDIMIIRGLQAETFPKGLEGHICASYAANAGRMQFDDGRTLIVFDEDIELAYATSNRKTPAQWSEFFGIEVLDPDGWDRKDPNCMSYFMTRDMFIAAACRSTMRVSNRERHKTFQHLFH